MAKTYSVTISITYHMEVRAETSDEAEDIAIKTVGVEGIQILHGEVESKELEDAQNEEDEAASRVASIEADMEDAQRVLDNGGHRS